MTKQEVHTWLLGVLRDTFEVDLDRVRPEATLVDLDLDSIDAVDVVVQFQTLTGKRVKPESFKSVRTVQDVVDALYDLVKD
jgi:acyl carrier protein